MIAVSAGNHAQGVAYHASRMGIPTVIVMPRFAPAVKVANTRRFGAEVVLEGETFDDAKAHGIALAAERDLVMVHPYDDEAIVAGQGTCGLEMLEAGAVARHARDRDRRRRADRRHRRRGEGAEAGHRDLRRAGRALPGDVRRGQAARRSRPGRTRSPKASPSSRPGAITLPIIERLVDDIVLVSESDIEHAIVMLLEIEKTVVEGAGAAGLAALLAAKDRGDTRFVGRRIGLVLCGGNIDPLMLAGIVERGMVRAGRLARIRVDLRDLPGALARATALIANAGANIEEVHHQRAFTTLPVQSVEVDFVMQTRGHEHIRGRDRRPERAPASRR